MGHKWKKVAGVVMKGHRVASGPSREYPCGSLEKQLPFFTAAGLDLEGCYLGTLNISIAPYGFKLASPTLTVRQVRWTELHPAEDFSFAPCKVFFSGIDYPGNIYYPHPETKIRHFQDPSLVEVICGEIKGIGYGSRVELGVDPERVRLFQNTAR